MFDENPLQAEQLTQWRCSCCGFSKPIGQFDTRELFRGETICGQCVREAAADRNRDEDKRYIKADWKGPAP